MIGHDQPFCVIGERINPTGRRIFQEQLRAGDLSAIERDVKAQVEGGADVLDVNMGVPLIDEAELLAKAITMIQGLTDLPICIDSSVVEALEAGLSVYQGRALVNSITAEDERMEQILPLVKKYDAAVIALPNDEDEIPMEPDKRLELVKKIVDVATTEYGIAMEDIVIDPLAMPIGADTDQLRRDHRDDAPDPRRVRPQHDLRRLQRLVRHAGPARARRDVPADGDDRRADQRDHGRPHPADRRGGQGRRPAARPRRVGHGLDRPRTGPRQAGMSTRVTSDFPELRSRGTARAGRGGGRSQTHDGTGRVDLSFTVEAKDGAARHAVGAGAARRHRLRLGVVERHRHRLHLRRPRHLPQVQGAGRAGRARSPGTTCAPSPPAQLAGGLAAGLPGVRRPATSRSTYPR